MCVKSPVVKERQELHGVVDALFLNGPPDLTPVIICVCEDHSPWAVLSIKCGWYALSMLPVH